MIYKSFELWGHWKCPHKSPSPCNTCHTHVIIHICVLINHTHTQIQTLTHTHTLTLTHTHSHKHTHTHTHVDFYSLWGLSISVMVFIKYKLYALLPYTNPSPKLNPHMRLHFYFPNRKLTLQTLMPWILMWAAIGIQCKLLNKCVTYIILRMFIFILQRHFGLIVDVWWNWLDDLTRDRCNIPVWTKEDKTLVNKRHWLIKLV